MKLSEADIALSLEKCAAEPVHIPGLIQPFGALIAFDRSTEEIAYASANAATLFGIETKALWGANITDILSPSVMHGIRNASSQSNFSTKRIFAGTEVFNDTPHDFHAFLSATNVVIELEPADTQASSATQSLIEVSTLLERMGRHDQEETLLASAVQLLQASSGYDRVMAYRFDKDFNGEVVAESKHDSLEPYLGLRFPKWDIPAQARDIMKKQAIRFISDVEQEPVPLLAASPEMDPLDITLANVRGVSPIHMEYLRNMKVRGTLTLSLVVEGKLWGIISFHHLKPKVPSNYLRLIYGHVIRFLEDRLSLIFKTATVEMAKEIEGVQQSLTGELEDDMRLEDVFDVLAPKLQELIGADGVVLLSSDPTEAIGNVPSDALLDVIRGHDFSANSGIASWECTAEMFPAELIDDDTPAGGLAIALADGRFFCFFRDRLTTTVRWAGAPDKEVTIEESGPRLSPRGSFAEYSEVVKDRCRPWSLQDISLARLVWTTVVSGERRVMLMLNKLSRQQTVLIDELNHRVRNIISLIRSVSRQARKHYSSLDSYSESLEQRIHALAAAHDIGAGQAASAISIQQMMEIEEEAFVKAPRERFHITGDDFYIKSEYGPLLALVIHEMTTNAAKYGALLTSDGHVNIQMKAEKEGLRITWSEVGGPETSEPEALGFGSTLITQAVPYELSGTANLAFEPEGMQARFWIPNHVLDFGEHRKPATKAAASPFATPTTPTTQRTYGSALVVEDNLMMALDMQEILLNLGFESVEITGTIAEANELIEQARPSIAILDLNLGPSGETTNGLARHLQQQGIPFMFVTGYGQRVRLDEALKSPKVLTKPVNTNELHTAIDEMAQKHAGIVRGS